MSLWGFLALILQNALLHLSFEEVSPAHVVCISSVLSKAVFPASCTAFGLLMCQLFYSFLLKARGQRTCPAM